MATGSVWGGHLVARVASIILLPLVPPGDVVAHVAPDPRDARMQFRNVLRFQAAHGAQTVPRRCPDGAQTGTRHGAQW